MSGEPRSGTYTAPIWGFPDIPGTDFQLRKVGKIESKISNKLKLETKLTSPKKLEEELEKAIEQADSLAFKDKYTFYQVAAGIASFGKYKPMYEKNYWKESYRAKKGEYLAGYYLDLGNRTLSTRYETEAKAKSAAKQLPLSCFEESGNQIKIRKVWKNKVSHSWSKSIVTGYISLERIGEMKSMPKKSPKSFLVAREYLWAWDGVLVDADYEYN